MKETKFMGVINVTPDSFSDGGRFGSGDLDGMGEEDLNLQKIVAVAKQMVSDGAEILDIGGESTGPGSVDVLVEEELQRVVPAVKAVREALPNVKISVDTWKSEVAEAALVAGADMINDITAGRADPRIFDVVAAAKGRGDIGGNLDEDFGEKNDDGLDEGSGESFGVPMILMYSKDDSPRTTREKINYDVSGGVMAVIVDFLRERIAVAKLHGVKEIIVDPGMGAFVSGDSEPSYEIIEQIEKLEELGCKVLVGTSRKSFLGDDRAGGTIATTVWLQGRVDFLRVHDVLENVTASC